MNRLGLLVALALTAVFVAVFGLYPGLDLAIARIFRDPATGLFLWATAPFLAFLRDAAMWLIWAIAAPSIVALVCKLIRPDKPLLIKGRTVAFFLITITLAAGILSNAVFKSYWGRPRPWTVTEFGGPWQYRSWWDPRGDCPSNCSFFSGEGATAFWSYAPAALAPPQWRPLAYAGATVFGLLVGLLRMAFGGHFLSDILAAGLVTFLTIWLTHGLIYRWAATRWSDDDVDAALTRFAWPLFSLWRGLLARARRLPRPYSGDSLERRRDS
jgi:lipid A 4'-phosphatase